MNHAFKTVILMAMTVVGEVVLLGQSFTTLVHFDGTNGAYPAFNSLVQGFDGNLYGTTTGAQEKLIFPGTVYKMTTDGSLTVIKSMGNERPDRLMQAVDGNFYGTTLFGSAGGGSIIRVSPNPA